MRSHPSMTPHSCARTLLGCPTRARAHVSSYAEARKLVKVILLAPADVPARIVARGARNIFIHNCNTSGCKDILHPLISVTLDASVLGDRWHRPLVR